MRKIANARPRIARLTVAAVIAVSTFLLLPGSSSATPSQADLDAAKAKLATLNNQISLLDEKYNQAVIALAHTKQRLLSVERDARIAHARSRAASRDLSNRAAAAYEGVGSELDLLLGSHSFTEFSDRLQFMGSMANDDQAAVDRANVARARARWVGKALAAAVKERQAAARSLAADKAGVQGAISDQEAFISNLQAQIAAALKPPPPPKNPPPAPDVSAQTTSTSNGSGSQSSASTPSPAPTSGGSTSVAPPPAPSSQVQAVLDAGYSVIGTPYVYAGSSPSTGFDCSGFTMWAWAHGGVSLPHSSAMQYAVLPHVDRTQLQPGDLLFFYSPIHHVAIYVGGGRMIHSPHTGGHVEVIPVYWQYYTGAARP